MKLKSPQVPIAIDSGPGEGVPVGPGSLLDRLCGQTVRWWASIKPPTEHTTVAHTSRPGHYC